MMDDNSSSLRKQAQPIAGKGKGEAERIKQAEKKKIRLEKALAKSLAIRAELEKKKQRRLEGLLEAEADDESLAKKKKKEELERIKQAEKKKIRLIAASAAIRAELEKKKLQKLEEQIRLDEEGAAIAEAAALHVLLGEDDSYRTMPNQETGFKPPWDCTAKLNLFTGGRKGFSPHERYSSPAVHRSRVRDCDWSVSYEPFARGWDNDNIGMSDDLIAAQAVSSLRISENARLDAVFFSGMFRR
ncbi:hypothetical protein HA466_0270990 [Hirschfeldia incana]|nr:hypothetical protein HA466_0270990 [Hirschfeldia incana]